MLPPPAAAASDSHRRAFAAPTADAAAHQLALRLHPAAQRQVLELVACPVCSLAGNLLCAHVSRAPAFTPGAARRAAAIGSSNRGGGSIARSAGITAAAAAPVDIAIEPGPANSRCIWAGVDIAAPAEAVYAALTSYESLGTFIPGLAENRCLERHEDGCTLLQAGQQDVALGVKFAARVCLRIREWPAGMPRRLLTRGPNAGGDGGGATRWWPFGSALSSGIPGYFGTSGPAWAGSSSGSRNGSASSGSASSGGGSSASGGEEEAVPGEWNERHWLRPRSPLGAAPAMDVSFDLVQGDFAAFRGLWRVQAAAPAACRLSYSLFVRPQPWLPVGLVEQRVAREIQANLKAVRAYVQAVAAGG